MISERIAPGMLPRVLNSFDMTIIFVAIVLFIVNASAIQQAHQAAYTYWILGFVAFLIPGALVTAQLGRMFAGRIALRLDAEGARPVLGLLRRLLRLVAGRPRDGRHGRRGRHPVAVHRPRGTPESVGAGARHSRRAVVLGVHGVTAPAHDPVVRERRGAVLRRWDLRHRPGRDPLPDR